MAAYPIDENDRTRIRTAIERAESRTSGEIYVVVARQSGDYRLIPIAWALIAALILPLPLIAFTRFTAGGIYLAELVIFVALALILSLPDLLPRIVPTNVLREHGHARAVEQFLAHGLTGTQARTGVLVFVSLAERYAEIVADTGIAAKVSQEVWDELIARLTTEIAAGRLAEGLIGAVERAGAVLTEHFPQMPGDRNELVNDVVLL